MQTCPYCSMSIEDGARTCRFCGRDLRTADGKLPEQRPQERLMGRGVQRAAPTAGDLTNSRLNNRVLLTIGAALVLCVAAAAGVYVALLLAGRPL